MASLSIHHSAPLSPVDRQLAAFDLDGTLVDTISGDKFPATTDDYHWLPNRLQRLLTLSQEGYTIVIITNQAYKDREFVLERLKKIMSELSIPFHLYAALEKDRYRKPHSTIIDSFFPNLDKEKSFYVGDAAGRPAIKQGRKIVRRADHSEVDRSFAYNCGIKFFTPEQFFMNETEELPPVTVFDGSQYLKLYHQKKLEKGENKALSETLFIPSRQELIMMIGYPGSGKSSFVKRFLSANYQSISMDELKTEAKTKKRLRELLEEGRSVVIDNTNPDAKARERYTELARARNIPIRYIYLNVSLELARHLNYFRESKGGIRVPEIAYRIFNSRLELPEDYLKIEFEPLFTTESDRQLFSQRSD